MKIKASEIKPGMVIGIDRGDNYKDTCLILAKKGFVEVEYTHLDTGEAYGGAMVGTIDGSTMVKVIRGKKRDKIIKTIKDEVFKNLHDIEYLIDMIRLIEAMGGEIESRD